MRLSRSDLFAALDRIAIERGLSPFNAAGYGHLAGIEGVAHELAHALDLGPGFEVSLRAMSSRQRNAREVSTLKIEIAALAVLGVRLSARRLWRTAAFDDDIAIPSLERLLATPTWHERWCTRSFVDEILAMHKRIEADQARRSS